MSNAACARGLLPHALLSPARCPLPGAAAGKAAALAGGRSLLYGPAAEIGTPGTEQRAPARPAPWSRGPCSINGAEGSGWAGEAGARGSLPLITN